MSERIREFAIILSVLLFAGAILAQSPAEIQRRRDAVRDVSARAAAGDPEALYQLSRLHETGYDSIARDSLRSITLLRQSAEAGYVPAANMLGYKLIEGDGIARDPREGIKWIERAAEADDPKALNNIGYLYLNGEGVGKDEAKAAYWLTKASEKGNSTARSMLGDLYRDGIGVEKDSARAEKLYKEAFEAGLTDAAYKLDDLLSQRPDTLSAAARLSEGLYYFNRTAPSVGLRYFRELADSLNIGEFGLTPELRAQAKALLGDAYSRGRGVGYDYDLSTRNYLDAARESDPSAAFVVGEMLEIFPDALSPFVRPEDPEDFQSASYWLEQARAAGIFDASAAMRRLHDVPVTPIISH